MTSTKMSQTTSYTTHSTVVTPHYSTVQTIYVDMDGVLADFDLGVAKIHQFKTGSKELFPVRKSGSWDCANTPDFFKFLPEIGLGVAMFNWLAAHQDEYGYRLGILSATGDKHDSVAKQKLEWLKRNVPMAFNQLRGRVIFVQSGVGDKHMYADSNVLLIDDTPEVVEAFRAAGGQTILFDRTRQSLLDVQDYIFNLK